MVLLGVVEREASDPLVWVGNLKKALDMEAGYIRFSQTKYSSIEIGLNLDS